MKDVTSEPLPTIPPRERDSHKGTYGRVLLVGGSRGMAGAISLSGMAALRSGAGLVTIATPRCIQSTVAGFSPSYMTVGLADNDDTLAEVAIDPLLQLVVKADVVAVGPGLGRSASAKAIVQRLYVDVNKPMILDADALNALAELGTEIAPPGGPRVLTPHPGELKRLTGERVGARPSTRTKAATQLAARDASQQTVVVLKGAGTVVTDHVRYVVNTTGNPGMATGGTGDVLTGVIAALVAQGLETWSAARLGVHIHGLAGDLAANEIGPVSLVATDVIDFLPATFQNR